MVVAAVVLAAVPQSMQYWSRRHRTPLIDDKHPCTAEALMSTNKYICDSEANVICLDGWASAGKLCCDPVCEVCINGECVAPWTCACEVGWSGKACDKCVPLPNCKYGNCTKALECNCFDGWWGAYCDMPKCDECVHGSCQAPNDCCCYDGWTGASCDVCSALPGCAHGYCNGSAWDCTCETGWTGHLCEECVPRDGCSEEHGFCKLPGQCLCRPGWKGPNCDECVPYWECPSAPTGECRGEPNSCYCPQYNDANPAPADLYMCNNKCINGGEDDPDHRRHMR